MSVPENTFAPGITIGTLGDRGHINPVNAQPHKDLKRHSQLAFTPVDQHQVRPLAAGAIRVFLQRAGKTPPQYLAHHGVIVAGGSLAGAAGGSDAAAVAAPTGA